MVVKKTTKNKKTSNSRKSKAKIVHKTKPKEKGILFPLFLILGLLIVGGSIFYFGGASYTNNIFVTINNYIVNDLFSSDTVLVTVNGEEIFTSELNRNWDAIPIETKISLSRDRLLEEMVEEKLLLQEAEKQNIMATEEEVDQYINLQLQNAGMTETQFVEILETQGANLETIKNIYRNQLTIAALFDSEVMDNMEVTDDEASTYYDENVEKFYQNEKVTVKHILTSIDENFNDTAAEERTDLILEKINAEEDFCTLVGEYSMDLASVSDCGEYTFEKGYMVPEFETVAFALENGDVSVAKTEYGYHIILKISSTEGKTLTLDDDLMEFGEEATVRDLIKRILMEERAGEFYKTYVANLKENANIVVENEIAAEVVEEANLDSFAKCLTESGAKMYGATWCSHCNAQREGFGESVKYIPYVECDESGENADVAACTEAGIEGFPTWVIEGNKYPGRQTHERLADLTGCSL